MLGCGTALVMMLAQPFVSFDSDAMYKQAHVSAKQNKGHGRVYEDFPDVVDLVTLDFEIQALFWNFHRVQTVYYQLVVNSLK